MNWLARFFRRSKPPLDADLLRRIRASFEEAASDEEQFPSTVDPRIYHVQLIVERFGDLQVKRVLDVGCGKGRFARVLKDRNPGAILVAFDLAEAMLRFVPRGIHRAAGSMTALPFETGCFDAVYATESIEHAVDIELAVSEMCRVVRPSGPLIIIDKNARHWGRLQTPEWETWFKRRQLERLLRRHCREVSSRYISYWADVAPDGLFIAWLARK